MRIVRFIDDNGRTGFGEPIDDHWALRFEGDLLTDLNRTTSRARMAKMLAPIAPADIICIGRNYRSHPKDAAPDERARRVSENDAGGASTQSDSTLEVFLKPSTAIQNPNDPIIIPHFDGIDPQVDCEGELAIVIGKHARDVGDDCALDYVFGYTIANDVTARRFQTPTGPPIWMRGKGFDTFCPLGPTIVTVDEIPDPGNLFIRTSINGDVVRRGNANQMMRGVSQTIAMLSRHITLQPGAIILTGAPPAAPRSLINGDHVAVEIDRIGTLRNTIVASPRT